MALDPEAVAKVARLARIEIAPERLAPLALELDGIMAWIDRLREMDTDNVAPMTSAVEMDLRWRDDRVDDGDCREAVLANAPEEKMGFFTVPKIIE